MAVEFVQSPLGAFSEMKYGILRTSWGYAAIRMAEDILTGITLPFDTQRGLSAWVAKHWGESNRDDSIGTSLQKQLIDYYDGKRAEFQVRVEISWANPFARNVLQQCARIGPGETISYGELSKRAGSARAARAAGSVLAKNRYPLIIPCHRVITASGKVGGFSAIGGAALKQRLLEHEKCFYPPLR